MNKTLSAKLKTKYLPIIIKRDCGRKCFYCGIDLTYKEHIFEHLDDDRIHNDVPNLVLSCRSCNNRKPLDPGMRLKAIHKLHLNKKWHLTGVSECISERAEVSAPTLSSVIDINQQNFPIVHQYLSEVIQTDGFFEYKEAIPSCAMLCRNKTGTGSQTAVRKYIGELTSRTGPFKIVTNDDKTRIIVKRDDDKNP